MNGALIVDPELGFAALAQRLAALGFLRDGDARPTTPDTLPGEPELAAWQREGARLTYTFNPVVRLRVLALAGLGPTEVAQLAARVPAIDSAAIGELLTRPEPRQVLLGLYAARALDARELALVVAPLQAHADPLVRQAAVGTLAALLAGGPADSRAQGLVAMQILCRRAVDVLAPLVGPDGDAALQALRPQPDDYARVFRADIADRARAAFERLWRDPPALEALVSGETTLEVRAAPAGMLLQDNELSRPFPGGYRALAPFLLPDRVWFTWRYRSADDDAGVRYDGVVMIDDRWAWFPKAYRVVGSALRVP
jgi:hypothetical protein